METCLMKLFTACHLSREMSQKNLYRSPLAKMDTGQNKVYTRAFVSTWICVGRKVVQYSQCQNGLLWGKPLYSMKRQKILTNIFDVDWVVHMEVRTRNCPQCFVFETFFQRAFVWYGCPASKMPLECGTRQFLPKARLNYNDGRPPNGL